MQYSVDQITGDYITLVDENEEITVVLKSLFGYKVSQGDIVKKKAGEYFKDEEATKKEKQVIMDLLKDIGVF